MATTRGPFLIECIMFSQYSLLQGPLFIFNMHVTTVFFVYSLFQRLRRFLSIKDDTAKPWYCPGSSSLYTQAEGDGFDLRGRHQNLILMVLVSFLKPVIKVPPALKDKQKKEFCEQLCALYGRWSTGSHITWPLIRSCER